MDNFIKNNFKPNKLDIIIFHYPCQDGLSSAWVANHFLRSINKEHELIPVQNNSYSEDFINNLINKAKNKYVGILDFSFNLEITEKLKQSAKGLIILDHHITNKNSLEKLDYAYFDMNKSGVGITWSYFYKNEKIPEFLEMIQDRDLWTWKIPKSKDFCDGFYYATSICDGFENSFDVYEDVYMNEESMTEKYIEIGKLLRKRKEKTIHNIVKNTKKIYNYQYKDNEYKVQIVNCDHEIASDLGNVICKNGLCDFAVLWRYDHNTESYWLSLRADNKVDVSEIAKYFGGGGHKNAAGCTIYEHPSKVFNNM